MSQPRQIELPSEEIDAVGCFLEYLYTGDYFPRKIPGQRQLELDPSLPKVDESGEQLLKHARVYTLADKFQVPNLRTLASSKIHCVNSTAKGEIAYARYVYAYTPDGDSTIRTPVASFWANRSHTLRAEAEPEFKALCLEYPQFGYDVLSKLTPSRTTLRSVSRCLHFNSPRPGREAQARVECQDAPCHCQRPQATSSQQHLSDLDRTCFPGVLSSILNNALSAQRKPCRGCASLITTWVLGLRSGGLVWSAVTYGCMRRYPLDSVRHSGPVLRFVYYDSPAGYRGM